jgi:hypothetical protein
MVDITASQLGTERAPSGLLQAIRAFVSAWRQASAAYAAYNALSTKSNAQLAARGLRRADLARSALGLPALLRE